MYAEARNDRKLDTLTDAQHRVWFHLLCLASELTPRGTFVHDESLALEVARGDEDLLAATIAALASRRLSILLDNGDGSFTFMAFEHRNRRKDSDLPEATSERKRKQREREREGESSMCDDDVSRDVTRCHAPVTHRGEERRREKNKDKGLSLETLDYQTAHVVSYFSEKVGRDAKPPELLSLSRLCKKYGHDATSAAIGQAAVQGERGNLALVTTILKAGTV